MLRDPRSVFYEVQRVREQGLMKVVLPAGLFLIAFFAYAMIRQLVLGEPFGDAPMSNRFLAVFGSAYIMLGVFLVWLYFSGKLITEVRSEGLFVRFYPFHRRARHVRFGDIEKCEVLTYRPIRDFGGWGIRAGRMGRAYNVSGNRGAYLTMKSGRRLLVGSQRADTLVGAITSYM
jgi:hypothetical protein